MGGGEDREGEAGGVGAHLHGEAGALALHGLAKQGVAGLHKVVLAQHLLQAAGTASIHVEDERIGEGG